MQESITYVGQGSLLNESINNFIYEQIITIKKPPKYDVRPQETTFKQSLECCSKEEMNKKKNKKKSNEIHMFCARNIFTEKRGKRNKLKKKKVIRTKKN